jgi:hypothetical protein
MRKSFITAAFGMLALSSAFANTEDPVFMPDSGNLYTKADYKYSDRDERHLISLDFGYGFHERFSSYLNAGYQFMENEGQDLDYSDFADPAVGIWLRAIKDAGFYTDFNLEYTHDVDQGDLISDDEHNVKAQVRAGKVKDKMTLASVLSADYNMEGDSEGGEDTLLGLGFDFQYRFGELWSLNNRFLYEYSYQEEVTSATHIGAWINYQASKRLLLSAYGDFEFERDNPSFGLRAGLEF